MFTASKDTIGRWFACLAAALSLISFAAPARATDFTWNNDNGGPFTKEANWLPATGGPGGAGDTVNFDLDIAPTDRYTVTDVGEKNIGGDENHRLVVHNDSLSLVLSDDYTLLDTSTAGHLEVSLNVGAASGDNADVILTGSGVLQTQASTIGQGGGNGVVTVENLQWVGNDGLIVGFFNSTGTLTIRAGASVSSTHGNIGRDGGTGTVVVDGPGSSWTSGFLDVGRRGTGFTTTGMLTIQNGGSVSSSGARIGSNGGLSTPATGTVTVSGAGSTWTNSGNLELGRGSSWTTGTLTVENDALVYVAGTLTMISTAFGLSTVNLDGGTLRFDGYSRDGTFNYTSGTIQLAGDRTIGTDAAVADLFGATPTIPGGKGLTIEGAATIQADLTLSGGTLRTEQLVDGGGQLNWTAGTLNVTGADGLSIGPAPLSDSTLVLTQNHTLEVDHALTIDGGATLIAASGLKAGSAVVQSAGQLFASGAMHDFGSGLTNHGDVVLSNTSVDGPVTNEAGGAITAIGDVRFNDLVDGPGGFFGPGTITFAGGMAPGASPAEVSFEGSVELADSNTLLMELGGTAQGTQYDALQIAGTAALDGLLNVSFVNSFTPSAGDTFEMLTAAGGIMGTFADSILPALPGELLWNINYDANVVTLEVAAPSLPGDFNGDGTIDAADYVAWRKTDGTQEGYDIWLANFGQTAGSGQAGNSFSHSAVPEPSTVWLLILGAAVGSRRGWRILSHRLVSA